MSVYAGRRIVLLIRTLLAIAMMVFAILPFVPGDSVRTAAGPNASKEDNQPYLSLINQVPIAGMQKNIKSYDAFAFERS